MAFKKTTIPTPVPETPDKLFLELPRRKFPDVLPHQSDVMRAYAAQAMEATDVALQLPTGSGKTLVGLLIGEWLRRRNRERVVYLCPTRQLVNQVVEQANEKYGLSVKGFTGSARDYSSSDKLAFQNADNIAVTTYSSLFNTNSFFKDAGVIIFDDAHAAEAYVSSLWSVHIERDTSAHIAMQALLKPHIEPLSYARISGQSETLIDEGWVEKIPTPILLEIKQQVIEALDTYLADTDDVYSWSMIRDHLHACHLYYSNNEIFIRPLIPPTWTHEPFNAPRQRIYMSATLGEGGDLERLTGRKKIQRLPVSEGWDQYGVGRRFFIFPEMSLEQKDAEELGMSLIRKAGRSLVLVPSEKQKDSFSENVAKSLAFPIFDAQSLESSKNTFITSEEGVMIVANRYDGIDFPGEECRLLFVEGLPKAVNLQERFLMSRMAANILFNERVQTRILQAIGRCTRSLEDYSAVVVSGDELQGYLADPKRRSFLHPELQAEISFGIEQSKGVSAKEIEENFSIFLENGKEWESVNQQIVTMRNTLEQHAFPAKGELGAVVSHEIDFQHHLWQGDYERALESAQAVLGGLIHSDLRGYRALWHYLAGSVAWMGAKELKDHSLEVKSRKHFSEAKAAAYGIRWLVALSKLRLDENPTENTKDVILLEQIERLENVLVRLGTTHDRNFVKREKEIIDGIMSGSGFEESQRLLGELLGFDAHKKEMQASPDPWWMVGNLCIVFEDYVDTDGMSLLSPTKARQASSHPNWMRENVEACIDAEVLPVLVSPVTEVSEGAVPQIKDLSYWSLEEFRHWTKTAISAIRELRTTFEEPGNLEWRAKAQEVFLQNSLDATSIFSFLKDKKASMLLKEVK